MSTYSQPTPFYTKCKGRGQACDLSPDDQPGLKSAIYMGDSTSYARDLQSGFMCDDQTFGAAPGSKSASCYYSNIPADVLTYLDSAKSPTEDPGSPGSLGFSSLGPEESDYTLPTDPYAKAYDILYGANSATGSGYVYANAAPGSKLSCKNSYFGDPIPSGKKQCWSRPTKLTLKTAAAVPVPPVPSVPAISTAKPATPPIPSVPSLPPTILPPPGPGPPPPISTKKTPVPEVKAEVKPVPTPSTVAKPIVVVKKPEKPEEVKQIPTVLPPPVSAVVPSPSELAKGEPITEPKPAPAPAPKSLPRRRPKPIFKPLEKKVPEVPEVPAVPETPTEEPTPTTEEPAAEEKPAKKTVSTTTTTEPNFLMWIIIGVLGFLLVILIGVLAAKSQRGGNSIETESIFGDTLEPVFF